MDWFPSTNQGEKMEEQKTPDVFNSLAEAAEYAHTCRQAVFSAIKKNQLKAEKKVSKNPRGRFLLQWSIKKSDLDEYRQSKYNCEKRTHEGEKLFDIEQDRLSVLHAAKILSEAMGRFYPSHRLYYLLRTGRVRGYKKAGAWIIKKEELINVYNEELATPTKRKLA
jgi:hypothetical protein